MASFSSCAAYSNSGRANTVRIIALQPTGAYVSSIHSVRPRLDPPGASTNRTDCSVVTEYGAGRDDGVNASDRLSDIVPHQLRRKPQHVVPEPSQVTVTPRIRCAIPTHMQGLLESDAPATGSTRLTDWARHPADSVALTRAKCAGVGSAK